MRARQPDAAGTVQRGAVDIGWERFGDGQQTLLLCGVDPIVDAGMWKAQVPWFAPRHTVITFDPPGNGTSSRTTDRRVYSDDEFVAIALDVLDANGVERAVVAGVCQGAGIALVLAADHADRVDGVVAINPGLTLSPPHAHRRTRRGAGFDDVLDNDDGWNKENRHYWLRDWAGYCDFYFGKMLPEPHSTKHHDDCIEWALGTSAEQMLAYDEAEPPTPRDDEGYAVELCSRVRCPVLVICGDRDQCQPPERSHRVAELTGGDLVVMSSSGHLPHARDPVVVNREISAFLGRLRPTVAARR